MGVSVQDAGRKGYLRYGVSAAGPMDWARHAMVNCMLKNPPGSAAIEVGPAGVGLSLQKGQLQMSFAGPGFSLKIDDQMYTGPVHFVLKAGQTLELVPRNGAVWGYLGLQGGFGVPLLLGSYSENSVSGLAACKVSTGSRLPVPGKPVNYSGVQAYVDPYSIP